ncbi:high-potential iron-sulfur protein [Massilia sp. 2TAF26]|uniref:high-potential iron-sulfur protein n=1 Tax=Massilia sp. 2TAF26 TaxID=3233012 RepID=UPI003F9C637C
MDEYQLARRRVLGTMASALPVLLLLPLAGGSTAARAGTARKEDFHYQDRPNEGKHCANCTAFVPPAAGQALGTCNIVAGPVSPDGWCMAFSPK